jgi:hypothetical protein
MARLLAAKEELRCANASLRRLRRTNADSLDQLDRQTQARLRDLVEEAYGELDDLADAVLDGCGEDQ